MDRRDYRAVAAETASLAEAEGCVGPDGRAYRLARAKVRLLDPAEPAPPGGPVACWLEVTRESTLGAARRLAADGAAPLCLVFASGRVPGGGFLSGARAQEEDVVRGTNVWPALRQMAASPFYAGRAPLYTDLALLADDVDVFRDDAGEVLPGAAVARVRLLFVAACNVRGRGVVRAGRAMGRRAGVVLEHARAAGAQDLVLGAWGCGVFRNDPAAVAGAFRRWLDAGYGGAFRRVVFAMGGAGRAEDAFRRVLGCGAPAAPPPSPDARADLEARAADLAAALEAHRRSGAAKPGWRVREAQAAFDRASRRCK